MCLTVVCVEASFSQIQSQTMIIATWLRIEHGMILIAAPGSRGPPRTESKVNKDFRALGFLNVKSQNFSKIRKF